MWSIEQRRELLRHEEYDAFHIIAVEKPIPLDIDVGHKIDAQFSGGFINEIYACPGIAYERGIPQAADMPYQRRRINSAPSGISALSSYVTVISQVSPFASITFFFSCASVTLTLN